MYELVLSSLGGALVGALVGGFLFLFRWLQIIKEQLGEAMLFCVLFGAVCAIPFHVSTGFITPYAAYPVAKILGSPDLSLVGNPYFNQLEVFERGVLLIGQTGAGKSSLINSFIQVYDREAASSQLQEAGASIGAVTMDTTEVNVTMRFWRAPDVFKPEVVRPMAMLTRFYDTRGFMDHHDDSGDIVKHLKAHFTETGPIMHSIILVIKVDRMGPLAGQLYKLLARLPKRTGLIMALTNCNHLSDQAIGAAEGTFRNEIVQGLSLQTFVTCLRPWESEVYPADVLEPIVLQLRTHERRWFFPGKREVPAYKLADLKSMRIKQLKDLADEHGVDVKGLYEQQEYLEVLQDYLGIKDEL
jgi:energy-coupling factor transporter ATP-binding protein EcfA2